MSDAQPIMTFISGLPLEEVTEDAQEPLSVYEIKFMCYIGEHEYSQIEYFFGTHYQATDYAENTAGTYWNSWEEVTEWNEQDQAWIAQNPYRGVRIDSVTKIDGLTCNAQFGHYLVRFDV